MTERTFPLRRFEQIMTVGGGVWMHECIAIYRTIVDHLDPNTEGVACDLGTHDGRSAMSALAAIEVVMGPEHYIEFYGVDNGYETDERYAATLARLRDYPDFVNLSCSSSIDWLQTIDDPFVYAFVDSGNHERQLLDAELALLKPKLVSGGLLLFHDYLNQFIAPGEVYAELVKSGEYIPIPIDWESIRKFVEGSTLASDTNCWAKYGTQSNPDIGHFVGALKKK